MPYGRRREIGSLADAYEGLRDDYAAAKSSRFRKRLTGVSAMGSGADYHYRVESEFWRLLEQARAIDRDDPVVGQAVDRVVANVVQDGITVDPQTGDEDCNALLAAKWKEWTEEPLACDKAAEHTFDEQAALALRHTIVDGDIVHLGLKEGSLEAVEAHRIRKPRTKRKVVHGFLLDEYRKKLEVWITQNDINPHQVSFKVGEMTPYPMRDAAGHLQVFHTCRVKRVSQTRGVSAFAPVVNTIGMHDDLEFAQLVKAQMAACWAILEEQDWNTDPSPSSAQTGAQTTETQADGTSRLLEGLAPGMRVKGPPGVKLSGFSPNVPNPEFFEHARLVLTFIAINLDLPLAVLLLDPSKTNFSGWRGAMDQARQGFRRLQWRLVGRFHRPVYQWKVRQWMAEGNGSEELRKFAARSDVNVLAHRWNPPTWPYIEPWKDSQADRNRLEGLLISPRRLAAERGRDWDDVAREIPEDNAKIIRHAIELAAEINRTHGKANVDWRELILPQVTAKPYDREIAAAEAVENE